MLGCHGVVLCDPRTVYRQGGGGAGHRRPRHHLQLDRHRGHQRHQHALPPRHRARESAESLPRQAVPSTRCTQGCCGAPAQRRQRHGVGGERVTARDLHRRFAGHFPRHHARVRGPGSGGVRPRGEALHRRPARLLADRGGGGRPVLGLWLRAPRHQGHRSAEGHRAAGPGRLLAGRQPCLDAESVGRIRTARGPGHHRVGRAPEPLLHLGAHRQKHAVPGRAARSDVRNCTHRGPPSQAGPERDRPAVSFNGHGNEPGCHTQIYLGLHQGQASACHRLGVGQLDARPLPQRYPARPQRDVQLPAAADAVHTEGRGAHWHGSHSPRDHLQPSAASHYHGRS
mmetsp:Transcript_71965/g.222477  ORF Transcript_71965/g.222477 Transcript_71965/m.222477 type:complete len:341 (+) Transcript_71965:186-1208(+)